MKRNVGSLARDWSLPKDENNHQGRSLDEAATNEEQKPQTSEGDNKKLKRQVDYSDEYPLPVFQNSNIFDYDELDDLFASYPNAQKRFMGEDLINYLLINYSQTFDF